MQYYSIWAHNLKSTAVWTLTTDYIKNIIHLLFVS